ncbi:hypothetical protein AS29_014070 [Bacillus sp. SJS]|nr:hypothetical protein AS29_014070 [Bacillus sp. SJS]
MDWISEGSGCPFFVGIFFGGVAAVGLGLSGVSPHIFHRMWGRRRWALMPCVPTFCGVGAGALVH